MQNTTQRKYIALSVGIFAAISFILIRFVGIHYAINDDIAFRGILNGSMNGANDAHLVFVKYALGSLFALLYKLSSSVDWYGLVSFTVIILSIFSVFICFVEKTSSRKEFLLLTVFFFFFTIITYGEDILFMQWTDTAVIAAATGMFLLYTGHDKKIWQKVLILFLFLFSYLLRTKCFLMMLPVLCVLLLHKYDFHLFSKAKRNQINTVFIVIFLGIACMSSAAEKMAYRSESWQKYNQYNNARSMLWDYYGVPPYDANKEFYDSLSLDREDVNMICMYGTNMIDGLDEVKIAKIADLAKEQYHSSHSMKARMKDLITGCYSIVTGPDYIFLEIELIVLSLLLLIKENNFKTNVSVVGIWAVGALMICYLVWTLRYPPRVVRGIMIIQICAVLAMLWKCYPGLMNRRMAVTLLVLALPFVMLRSGKLMKGVLEFRQNDQDTLALEQYVNAHPDQIFIEEARVEPNHQFILSHERKALNVIPTGGWTTLAPFRQQQMKMFGIADLDQTAARDDVILIMNEWDDPGYLDQYLKCKGYDVHIHEAADVPVLRGYKLYQFR